MGDESGEQTSGACMHPFIQRGGDSGCVRKGCQMAIALLYISVLFASCYPPSFPQHSTLIRMVISISLMQFEVVGRVKMVANVRLVLLVLHSLLEPHSSCIRVFVSCQHTYYALLRETKDRPNI
jgi:hypothetical protein